MPDAEAEALRDGFRSLAEIVFEQWQRDREAGKLDKYMQTGNQNEFR